MGTSLTGKNISASYLGLLKSTDNSAISTSAKTITDGAGNDLPIKLSTAQFLVSDGSVSAPSIGFSNETNTGFYHTTGEINATIAGTNKITIDGSQTHIKGSTLLIDSSDDSGELRFNYSSATDSRSWEMRNDVLSDGDFWLGVSDTRTGSSYSTVMNINRSGNIALGGSSASSVYNIYLGDKTFVRGNNTTALTINRSASYGDILELQSQGGVFAQFSGIEAGTTRIFQIDGYDTDSEIRLSTSGSNRFIIDTNGNVRFNSYGGGTITGTATQRLGVDSSGNVIEIPIGAGAVDGAGATGQASFWVDSDTISGDDDFYWDNTNKRLGIGTNNPNQLLELSKNGSPVIRLNSSKTTTGAVGDSIGRIEFRGSSTAGNGAGIKAVIDTSATTTTQRDFDLLFKTGNNVGSGEPTTSMVIGADGNVGISTDSPNRNLTIKNSSDGANGLSFQSYATTSEVGYIRYEQTNDIIDIFNTSSYSGSGIKFSTNSADAMFLDVDGNLGIGVSSTNGLKTVIKGTSGYPATTGTTQTGVLRLSGGTGLYNVLDMGVNESTDTAWIQATRANTLAVYDDLVLNPYGGSVGIGTSSPTGKLSVEASGNHLHLRANTATAGKYWNFDITSANQLYIVNNGGTGMTIKDTGEAGIGTSSPDYLLHLEKAGTIMAQLKATDSNQAYMKFVNSTTGDGAFTDGILFGLDTDESAVFWNYEATPIRFATSGSEAMRITSGGTVKADAFAPLDSSTSVLDFATDNEIKLYTNSTERMRITSNGDVLLRGGYNPYTTTNRGNITLNGTASNIIAFTNGSAERAYIYNDLSNLIIRNVISGDLRFDTNSTERARITSDGYLRLSSTSSGIQFNGDTGASNALDDYEEGTWTPSDDGNDFNINPTTLNGRYTKIGRQVIATFTLEGWEASSGNRYIVISGLPYNQHTGSHFETGFCTAYPNASRRSGIIVNNTGGNTTQWYVSFNLTNNVTSGGGLRGTIIYTTS